MPSALLHARCVPCDLVDQPDSIEFSTSRVLAPFAVVLPFVATWAWLAVALAVIGCDDNCGRDGGHDWRYAGQAVLAFVGMASALIALPMSSSRYRRVFRMFAITALVCAGLWITWIAQGSF